MEKPKLRVEDPFTPEQVEKLHELDLFIRSVPLQKDIRDLKGEVQRLLGDSFSVGCSGSHIWIHDKEKEEYLRQNELFLGHARIALIVIET